MAGPHRSPLMVSGLPAIAPRLLAWHAHHGRRHLPWQQNPTPYRVWISEIMLQQTQVSTVIPYFQRFTDRFPDVRALAEAPLDTVLHLWSGLGYYARARNLHLAAEQLAGADELPEDLADLQALPGIGRSTAGAILALSRGERHPILDGNVKRVLCRYHGIDQWPGQARVQAHLWQLADAHTPMRGVAAYTQAIMDMGATLCTRSRPNCTQCPLARDCTAHRQDRVGSLPVPRPRRDLPERRTVFVMAVNRQQEVFLERRPPTGVWGGLWCFPEANGRPALETLPGDGLGFQYRAREHWKPLTHTFTHFRLVIEPVLVRVDTPMEGVLDPGGTCWYKLDQPRELGLAAPVAKLIERLRARHSETWK